MAKTCDGVDLPLAHIADVEPYGEALVDKPGGADYSAGAEASSVICLENIQRIIEQVRPKNG